MKTRSIGVLPACLTAMVMLAAAGLAQDTDYKAGQKADQAPMSAEVLAWMKAATPNENHRLLDHSIGKWNCTVKSWQSGADEPAVSKGVSVSKWILQKHFVQSEFKGSVMNMPFVGQGISGYDNIKKHFFSIWCDSMSTGPMIDTGTYDPATKTFTYKSTVDTPMGTKMLSRTTIKVVSDDRHILTMYQGETAEMMKKVLEITYNRDRDLGAATPATDMKVVLAGCASCQFHMDGVSSCQLAVKIDGKPYLVSGADVSAHDAGLCRTTKKVEVAGKIVDGKFVARTFVLKD